MNSVCERICEIRKKFNPNNATAFAKSLGLNQPTYARYENGDRKFPLEIIEKIINLYNVNAHWIFTGKGNIFITTLSRKTPDNDAAYWLHNWGERLLAIQKFFGYSDEKMAEILGITKIRYIDLITKSPFPKEKELNAFKDNFQGVTVDELLYNDSKTFYSKLKKDDKLDIDLSNLPPEKLIQIKNLLKEI